MNLFDWQSAAYAFISLALGTVIRSLILAALCGLAVWFLRSRPAALRFSLWKWTLLSLLALPILISLTPPVPQAVHPITHIHLAPLANSGVSTTHEPQIHPTRIQQSRVSITLIPTVYLLLTFLLLARLAYNLLQLRRIANRSHSISDPAFREFAHDLWLCSGAPNKPRFVVSHELSVPVTFNSAGDSWVLLPPTWTEWEEPKLRAVLTHELAHVQRNDSANLLLAGFATCLFWFHPLSWFLQRQLSRLAGEACDEIVLATTTPEQYAHFLIAFAADVQRQQHRLAIPATAVVRQSNLKNRIERLFTDTRPLQNSLAAAFLALFVATLYLTAAARFSDPPKEPSLNWEHSVAFSPADLANIESAIEANPDQVDLRVQLAVFFAHDGQDQPFTSQILWLIQHHPAQPALASVQWFFIPTKTLSDTSRNQIRAAWEVALAKYPNSAPVLSNAASFIDPLRGVELLRKAQSMEPENAKILSEISIIYMAAETQALGNRSIFNNIRMTPEAGAKLRAELANSQDPALLTEVGRFLAELDPPLGSRAQRQRGLDLLNRAVQLDPSNPKWRDALQHADLNQAISASYQHLEKTADIQVQQGSGIIIPASVAEANLVTKPDPIYPPDALAARIQGVIEFTATVGTEGTVTQLQLVRGDPKLVSAAKDAVLKSVYHPATQNGQPIPFVTDILVSFKLPN